jgi:sugar phosphate isomerase/epimerase
MEVGYLVNGLDQIDDVARWGFEYAEIFPALLGPPHEDDAEIEGPARDRILNAGVPSRTMCGFLPDPEALGLMVVGPQVDPARLRSYAARVFQRMERVNCELMVFGSGTARNIPDGFPRDEAHRQFAEYLKVCSDLAEAHGIRIAIEPQNYDDTNLIHTVPEAMVFANEVKRPNVQVMADFFHMVLNREPLSDLTDAGPALIHGHIAEPGRGRPQTTPAEHQAFFNTLHQAGYNGRVTQTGPLPVYESPEAIATALKSYARAGVTS